jgi:hypothetical protein
MRRRDLRRSFPVLAAAVLLSALAVAAVAACGDGSEGASPSPADSAPASGGSASPDPAAGSKMAPGLYDLEDGSVVAVGTVEFADIEGGFWAVIGGTAAEGNEGEVVAVIVNGEEFADQFRANAGLSFEVYGERGGEVSIRMAGPEMIADRVVLAAEGGPAE